MVGSDGGRVGTVDRLEHGRTRLTRGGDPDGNGQHPHALPLSVVDTVTAGRVLLAVTAQQARAMAASGLGLADMQDGATTDDDPEENAAGAATSPTGEQGGTGIEMIHGDGTAVPGFPDDPRMDRHGGGGPNR